MKIYILKQLKIHIIIGASKPKMFTGSKTMNKFLTNRILVFLSGSKEERSILHITVSTGM